MSKPVKGKTVCVCAHKHNLHRTHSDPENTVKDRGSETFQWWFHRSQKVMEKYFNAFAFIHKSFAFLRETLRLFTKILFLWEILRSLAKVLHLFARKTIVSLRNVVLTRKILCSTEKCCVRSQKYWVSPKKRVCSKKFAVCRLLQKVCRLLQKAFLQAFLHLLTKILFLQEMFTKVLCSSEKCYVHSQKYCIPLKNFAFTCKVFIPEKLCVS